MAPRHLLRGGAAALSVVALAGCEPPKNAFAPACPNVGFVQPVSDLTRYRPGSQGVDVTNLELRARIKSVGGKCENGDSKSQLDTTVTVIIDVQRGFAMQGRQADLPLFVAVAEGNNVLDKKLYALHIAFPPNVDNITVSSEPVPMTLPVSATKSGAAYTVIAGFQLTPDELAANQRKAAR